MAKVKIKSEKVYSVTLKEKELRLILDALMFIDWHAQGVPMEDRLCDLYTELSDGAGMDWGRGFKFKTPDGGQCNS